MKIEFTSPRLKELEQNVAAEQSKLSALEANLEAIDNPLWEQIHKLEQEREAATPVCPRKP